MDYLTALTILHRITRPNLYVEIGCRKGFSLSLAECPSLAIDPDFQIERPLRAPTRIFRSTSDSFFAEHNLVTELGGHLDLAFIDGMHLAEYALRDFINLEKHSHPNSIIVIDDILPSKSEMATRERTSNAWTGDVYKVIPLLRQLRPDLTIDVFDIEMKGMAVIRNLNPHSTLLESQFDVLAPQIRMEESTGPDIEEIRKQLAPRPVDEFENFVTHSIRAFPSKSDTSVSKSSNGNNSRRYLSLMKDALLGEVYLDNDLRIFYLMECLKGSDTFAFETFHDIRNKRASDYEDLKLARDNGYLFKRRIENAGFSHTMAGRKRLDQLHLVLETIREQGIAGDFVECGVWRGGSSIFAKAYFDCWEMSRKVWVADSFAGLPPSSVEQDAKLDLSAAKFPQLAVSAQVVRQNFEAYHLFDSQVIFLEGWFKDTLHQADISQVSVLRLDGDLYESTMDALKALYHKLPPGGAIIVDDYFAIPQCKQAVDDYFASTGQQEPQWTQVDWTCVHGFKPF